MRIWDLSPKVLCRQHLLGEHRELHSIWTVIVEGKKGYSKHPETLRWIDSLGALYLRHEELAKEMQARGYKHLSPLDKKHATGHTTQKVILHTKAQQIEILKLKNCDCKV